MQLTYTYVYLHEQGSEVMTLDKVTARDSLYDSYLTCRCRN